jgi:hypothetical protein
MQLLLIVYIFAKQVSWELFQFQYFYCLNI